MRGYWQVALGVAAAVLLAASAANADVVAVIDHRVPSPSRTDNDIVLVNAGTGAVSPVSFDTIRFDEIHPSVSSDGSRIAYESYNRLGGAFQMAVADVRTGQSVGVPEEFQDYETPRTVGGVAISMDGQSVLTSGSCQQRTNSNFAWVVVNRLSNFPNGPFQQSGFSPGTFPQPCGVTDPVLSGPLPTGGSSNELIAATLTQFPSGVPSGSSSIILSGAPTPLSSDTASYSDPSFGSPDGVPTVLFEESSSQGQLIASRPALPVSSFVGPPQPVSGINFTNGSNPTITADGRYIGFLRSFPNQTGWFLFVWDTTTQMLLNPQGVNIGDITVTDVEGHVFPDSFGPYLYEITVFRSPGSITSSGTVNFALASSSPIGILVQRAVGHHQLFGRRVLTLRVVGHVPLGVFKRGEHRLHWNLKVNGRRLKRGTYQVTLRSLTRSKKIRDFGGSRIIHVR